MRMDTHVHTEFSCDSQMKLQDALKKADALQIGMTLTEHMDLSPYPWKEVITFDVEKYFAAYAPYCSENLLLGIEIGMQPQSQCLAKNRRLAAENDFDYVLGSVHMVGAIDIHEEEFFQGRSKQVAYQEYLQTILKCIQAYDFIDSLGHIDYIARYASYADQELHYSEFAAEIDEILRFLAAGGKALEINTRRLDNTYTAQALLAIYRRFAEVGGKLVTIGSDSHWPENVGQGLAWAEEIAQLSGLQVVWFKKRQPCYQLEPNA